MTQVSELELAQLQIQLSYLDTELQDFCNFLRLNYGNVDIERLQNWQTDPINSYGMESLDQMVWKLHHLRQLIHLHRNLCYIISARPPTIAEMHRDAIQYLDSR